MKHLSFITAAALALAAAPAFADMSPAEIFGASKTTGGSSAAAYDMAVDKLSGDDLDTKIVPPSAGVASRTVLPGNEVMAADLGVNAADYTTAEIVKMYIGKYD